MKKLILFLSLLASTAFAQIAPATSGTKFVRGSLPSNCVGGTGVDPCFYSPSTGPLSSQPVWHYNGVDTALYPGGGSNNGILGAYLSASGPSSNILTQTSALGALVIRDANPSNGFFFSLQDNSGTVYFNFKPMELDVPHGEINFTDLTNTAPAPLGSGSIAYSNTTHTLVQSVNGGNWTPIAGTVSVASPIGGDGSGGNPLTCTTCVLTTNSLGGDLTGNLPNPTVAKLQGTAVSNASPTSNQFLQLVSGTWTPVTLTQDMISPAFTVTLARNGFVSPIEAGTSITNPQFTDSHNQTPASATLTDFVPTVCSISPATATALGYGGAANTCPATTYTYCGSLNCTRSWTYSATNASSVTKTASVSVQWEPLVYFGIQTPPGGYDSTFITGLPSSGLQASQVNASVAIGAGGGTKKAYYVVPSSYTNPSTFKDVATGFAVDMTKVASSVSVTNSHSVTINYDVWESVQFLNAAFTMSVN